MAPEFSEEGRTCRPGKIVDPTWEEVAGAIRRMDGERFPLVFINLSKSIERKDMNVLRDPGFVINGGQGKYSIMCPGRGRSHLWYCDPARGEKAVDIVAPYLRGLLTAVASKYVCRDVEVALRAARCFCETGGCDPNTPWSERTS